MRKLFKMLNLALTLIILLSTILPVTFELSKVIGASFTITYNRTSKLWTIKSTEILK